MTVCVAVCDRVRPCATVHNRARSSSQAGARRADGGAGAAGGGAVGAASPCRHAGGGADETDGAEPRQHGRTRHAH